MPMKVTLVAFALRRSKSFAFSVKLSSNLLTSRYVSSYVRMNSVRLAHYDDIRTDHAAVRRCQPVITLCSTTENDAVKIP